MQKVFNRISNSNLLIWFVPAVCLGFLVLICINAVYVAKPHFDDFAWAASVDKEGIYNVSYGRLTTGIQGRLTQLLFLVFSYAWLNILEYYYINAFIYVFLVVVASLYFFYGLRSYLKKQDCFFLAIVLAFLHLCVFSPGIVSGVYWVSAAAAYQISIVFLLFSLGAFLRLWLPTQSKKWYVDLSLYLILTLSMFLAAQAHEQVMCTQICIYILFTIIQLIYPEFSRDSFDQALHRRRSKLIVYMHC